MHSMWPIRLVQALRHIAPEKLEIGEALAYLASNASTPWYDSARGIAAVAHTAAHIIESLSGTRVPDNLDFTPTPEEINCLAGMPDALAREQDLPEVDALRASEANSAVEKFVSMVLNAAGSILDAYAAELKAQQKEVRR